MIRRAFFVAVAMTAVLTVSHAQAAIVSETEPNNTLADADDVDGFFTTDFVTGIQNANGVNTSTTIPHVSYEGGGGVFSDSGIRSDYFRFHVTKAGTRGVFDVDSYSPISNTELYLYDEFGNLLAENENQTSIDEGSLTLLDPFLTYTFSTAGLYIIGIGGFASVGSPGGITGAGLLPTDTYVVHASLNAVPEPVSVLLFGAGVAGLVSYRRRKTLAIPESSNV